MKHGKHLYSVYRRIKNNCCEEWMRSSKSLYAWYENQVKEQQGIRHFR